jgi:hypothetical protein
MFKFAILNPLVDFSLLSWELIILVLPDLMWSHQLLFKFSITRSTSVSADPPRDEIEQAEFGENPHFYDFGNLTLRFRCFLVKT